MAILDTGLVFSASLDRTLRTWRLDTFTGGESRYYIDTIDIIDTYTLHTCTGGQYVEYTSFVTAPTLKMPNVHVTFSFTSSIILYRASNLGGNVLVFTISTHYIYNLHSPAGGGQVDCVEDHTDYVQCLCVEAGWVATGGQGDKKIHVYRHSR